MLTYSKNWDGAAFHMMHVRKRTVIIETSVKESIHRFEATILVLIVNLVMQIGCAIRYS